MSKINFAPSNQTRVNSGRLFQYLTLGVILLSLVGCGQNTAAPPGVVYRKETVVLPTGAPTSKPTLVNTRVVPQAVFTPGPTPTITPIPDRVRGLVVEVVDGDTIGVILEGDPPGHTYQVRYLGIDVPPNAASVPWGVVAFEVNHQLTSGKVVRLERDQSDTDADDRLLRYVYVGDQNLSVILAEQGLARASIQEPDTRFQDEILEAEQRARENRLGLWGPPPTSTPTVSGARPAVITSTTSITATALPESVTTATAEPQATEEETPTGSPSPTLGEPTALATESGTETPESVETPTSIATSEPTVEATLSGDSNGEDLQGPP